LRNTGVGRVIKGLRKKSEKKRGKVTIRFLRENIVSGDEGAEERKRRLISKAGSPAKGKATEKKERFREGLRIFP